MKHDRLDYSLEVEQEEVAHEIEARRQRREIAFERRVERILLVEREAFGRVAERSRHPLRERAPAPFGAVDRHQAGVEIGGVERKAERAARSLELSRQRV